MNLIKEFLSNQKIVANVLLGFMIMESKNNVNVVMMPLNTAVNAKMLLCVWNAKTI